MEIVREIFRTCEKPSGTKRRVRSYTFIIVLGGGGGYFRGFGSEWVKIARNLTLRVLSLIQST